MFALDQLMPHFSSAVRELTLQESHWNVEAACKMLKHFAHGKEELLKPLQKVRACELVDLLRDVSPQAAAEVVMVCASLMFVLARWLRGGDFTYHVERCVIHLGGPFVSPTMPLFRNQSFAPIRCKHNRPHVRPVTFWVVPTLPSSSPPPPRHPTHPCVCAS